MCEKFLENREEKKELTGRKRRNKSLTIRFINIFFFENSEPNMIDRVKDDYFHFLREGVFISLIYFRSVLAFEVGKNIVVTVLSTKKMKY